MTKRWKEHMEMRWFSSSANFEIENSHATLSLLIMFYRIFDLLVRDAASRLILASDTGARKKIDEF